MKEQKTPAPGLAQRIAIIVACLLCVVAIVFLKTESDSRSPVYAEARKAARAAATPDSIRNMAVPDTVGDATVLPLVVETLPPAMPDSVGRDARSAGLAGHEDGYLAGCYDAEYAARRSSYDDTNTFPSAAERRAYSTAYAEGYEKGFAEVSARAHGEPSEASAAAGGPAIATHNADGD